jgi:hypothetical protein
MGAGNVVILRQVRTYAYRYGLLAYIEVNETRDAASAVKFVHLQLKPPQ